MNDKYQDKSGPAFPEVLRVKGKLVRVSGMTLRDYFAAKAMQGELSSPSLKWAGDDLANDVARNAYIFADAMLKAREA